MTNQVPIEKRTPFIDYHTIQILEELPLGVFLRQNGKIVFINKFFLRITGCGIKDISLEVLEEDDTASGARLEMASAKQRSIFKCLTSNGKEIYMAAQGVKIESPDGPGVLYFLEDVPAGKRKEKTTTAEARLFDMVSDGVICLDLELKITAWYRGAEHIFGYSRSEAIGNHLSMLYEKGKDGLSQPQESEFHEKGEGFIFEMPCRTRDGKGILATFSISIINDEWGRPTGFVATVQDITRKKHEQQALQQSEKHYRTLVNAIPDYLYIVQIRGKCVQILFHGPQCQRITGYTPDDYYRDEHLWFRMVHPEDRHRVQAFAQALNEGNEVPPIEHRIYHRDGSVRWLRNSASANIISASPREVIIHGIISEIPRYNHHQNEQMGREALNALIEKINSACKEFDLPIQMILGRTELLLRAISQDEPQYQLIKVIVDQVQHMAEINRKLNDILGYRTMATASEKRIIEMKTPGQQRPDSLDDEV